MGVLIIALANILQHFFVIGGLAFFHQLFHTALGTGFGAGGEKDLHGGLRQDHRADITAVHQHILLFGHAALQAQQKLAHTGVCGYGAGSHAHLLLTNGFRNILAVQINVLCAVNAGKLQMNAGQQLLHGGSILQIRFFTQAKQTDRAVHGAGVYINIAQLFGKALGQGGFSGSAGAIDCNRDHCIMFLSVISILYYTFCY